MRFHIPGAILALALAVSSSVAHADERPISGSGRALEGGRIAIGNDTVALAGVAVPTATTPCREWGGGNGTSQDSYNCGQHARAFLESMIAGRPIACVTTPAAPQAGRPRPARCYADGRDVAEAMVAAGWAVTTERASNRYVSAQETARLARRGMWAGPFEMPGMTPGPVRRTP